VRYVVPLLRQASVLNLLLAAGVTAGVGDWRPEKGKGDYGQFEIATPGDSRVQERCTIGREAQLRAFAEPRPYDSETAELLSWYQDEFLRRTGAPATIPNGMLEPEGWTEEELEVVG
jgi:hypothetical protein